MSQYRAALSTIGLVVHKLERLPAHSSALAQDHRVEKSLTDRGGNRGAVGGEFIERLLGGGIRAKVHYCHEPSVRRMSYASRVISTFTNRVEPNGPAYTPRSGGTSL